MYEGMCFGFHLGSVRKDHSSCWSLFKRDTCRNQAWERIVHVLKRTEVSDRSWAVERKLRCSCLSVCVTLPAAGPGAPAAVSVSQSSSPGSAEGCCASGWSPVMKRERERFSSHFLSKPLTLFKAVSAWTNSVIVPTWYYAAMRSSEVYRLLLLSLLLLLL